MSPADASEVAKLKRLFSMVFTIDSSMQIGNPSESALKFMPWLSECPVLTSVFEVSRPGPATSVDDLVDREKSLFLLKALDGSFALRGQVMSLHQGKRTPLVFCGSPWLHWITRECPDVNVGMDDFSPQDAQLDQLFYINTEQAMVADLESLTEDLQAAKAQMETSQRARDDFFTRMSHEMRTPLNGVVSGISLLEHHELPGEARELTGLVRQSSRDLMHVINYVLDISKIESEDKEGRETPFEFEDLFRSVFDIVRPRAQEKSLELESRISPDLSLTYLGDWAHLRQALLNLVTNAVKFTPSGKIVLEADPGESAGVLQIRVTDTGIGMPPEVLERIFEPFFSINAPGAAPEDAGTGLGLDIVNRSVTVMGGQISVNSTEGKGTVFILSIPLRAIGPEDQAYCGADDQPKDTDEAKLSGRVLLVDDNTTNLMLGRMQLERLGLEVIEAASGEAALERIAADNPHLVLMDISMPGMDGFETTRRIRAQTKTRDLPVIALTAYASTREQDKSRDVGMNGYLTKPVGQAELGQALIPWLRGKPLPLEKTGSGNNSTDDPIDWQVLDTLTREIGAENVALALSAFAGEAANRWQNLLEAEDPSDQARHAHFLVSTSRSFGLSAVADQFAELEQQARQGEAAHAQRLDAMHLQFKSGLDEVLQKLKA